MRSHEMFLTVPYSVTPYNWYYCSALGWPNNLHESVYGEICNYLVLLLNVMATDYFSPKRGCFFFVCLF